MSVITARNNDYFTKQIGIRFCEKSENVKTLQSDISF